MLEDRAVGKLEVARITGLSTTHIDRLGNPKEKYYDPTFPKRFVYSSGGNAKVFWMLSAVLQWLQNKTAKQHGSDPANFSKHRAVKAARKLAVVARR